MTDDTIAFDGDDLARKVPMISRFREQVTGLGMDLKNTLAQNDFAAGATDQTSLYAASMFQQLMGAFGQIYGALGEAVGLQGDRLAAVRQIGDATEGAATEQAGGWSESTDGHHG